MDARIAGVHVTLSHLCPETPVEPSARDQADAFFHVAAKMPAPISKLPPVRLTMRCTRGLRIARRAAEASIA